MRDIERSIAFYERLGFTVLRQEPDFAVIALREDLHVLLAAEAHTSRERWNVSARGVGLNICIMVDDVDAVYQAAKAAGAPIGVEIADRDYGLRDFILTDPDGFCLRFASSVTRG